MTRSDKIRWTVSNLLMLLGLYLLLFVGGRMADEQYNVYAARGDTSESLPAAPVSAGGASVPVASAPVPTPPSATAPEPTATERAPSVRRQSRLQELELDVEPASRLSNIVPPAAPPEAAPVAVPSTVTRIVIPAIGVDRKVVEVGWTVQKGPDGQDVAVWNVDKYRVGHHTGTSNPGGGGNIVLAGHSGGPAYPFNDIFYLKGGDQIQLYSAGQIYDYRVSDHILLDEEGQPLEKRRENARYIGPTDEEMITMVACWPLTGPDKFKQRIVIRAKPAAAFSAAP